MNLSELKTYENNVLFGVTPVEDVPDSILLIMYKGKHFSFGPFYMPDFGVWCMIKHEIERRREQRLKEHKK